MLKPPKFLLLFLSVMGPGLIVMFADTDAGSIITAAQSGSIWGYRLLLLQFLLIPILFIAQELTVRLGIVTKKGHGELILQHFGRICAWFSISVLLLSCIGAIITEFSGLAGVGMLFGVSSKVTMLLVVLALVFIVISGSYRSVEYCALVLGAFELVFLYVAVRAHPNLSNIKAQILHLPLNDPSYLYLAAANIGAVIMPWMIFYQQSAVIDKGLQLKHLKAARIDTAIGAVITQLVMIGVLMATAATLGRTHASAPLNTVQEISKALTPFLGNAVGKILFSLGVMGCALVAAIVVSLTAAWSVGELIGYKRSLQDHPKEAPWFYGIYTIILILGAILVTSGINLVKLSVAVEVMNAILLPVALGFLFLLAIKALPKAHCLQGKYAKLTGMVLGVTALFGFIAGIWGSF